MEVAIIKNIFRLLFLFILIDGVVACNKDAVKEEKPIKVEKVVNLEDAEKLLKGYSTERWTINDASNPPIAEL